MPQDTPPPLSDISPSPLTDADTTVAADTRDIRLRNGSHPQLVERPREEGGERGDERHGAVSTAGADRHAHQVLLGDEALDVVLRTRLAETRGRGSVKMTCGSVAESVLKHSTQ